MNPTRADDQVAMPPAEEIFVSPGGRYRLHLFAAKDWQNERPRASLGEVTEGEETVLWERPLPHEVRPRMALVDDAGHALLLDEWWNTRSGLAVMVLDPAGDEMARHPFAAVEETLGVPAAQLVEKAKHGPWIGGLPRFQAGGARALVPAGGRHLAVDLRDGALSALPAD